MRDLERLPVRQVPDTDEAASWTTPLHLVKPQVTSITKVYGLRLNGGLGLILCHGASAGGVRIRKRAVIEGPARSEMT